jgi:hypothetical protein
MKTRLIWAAVLSLSLLAGCSANRPIGRCTYGGAIVGGVVGAAAGAVIGVQNNSDSGVGPGVAGGFVGIISGAILGGVAGHYICDPHEAPPPPPSRTP